MATKTFTAKTKGQWVQLSTLSNFDFVDGKDYTLQVLGTAKFGDDGKTGILIDSTTPYTYTHKSGVDLYVMTENEDGAVITVSDSASLALATRGGGSGGGSGDAVWGSITGTLSDQTDLAAALAAKQDTLTAGTGIDITNDVISVDSQSTTEVTLATVATTGAYSDLSGKPTAFTGADGSVAGSAGLVPAPAATDNDKYLKGDGTWATVSGGGLQNTATSSSSLTILGTPNTSDYSINIGENSEVIYNSGGEYDGGIAIGYFSVANERSVSLGYYSISSVNGTAIGTSAHTSSGVALGNAAESSSGIALGSYAQSTASGAIQIGQGTNSTANTLSVGLYGNNYQLLDDTGKIPNDRIDGATGSFTSQDGKTVTVTNGVITSIV